jgi:hypothetical protein
MNVHRGDTDPSDRRIMLLMPATSYRATDFMAAARKLNAEVIVASDHAQVLAAFVGDFCPPAAA